MRKFLPACLIGCALAAPAQGPRSFERPVGKIRTLSVDSDEPAQDGLKTISAISKFNCELLTINQFFHRDGPYMSPGGCNTSWICGDNAEAAIDAVKDVVAVNRDRERNGGFSPGMPTEEELQKGVDQIDEQAGELLELPKSMRAACAAAAAERRSLSDQLHMIRSGADLTRIDIAVSALHGGTYDGQECERATSDISRKQQAAPVKLTGSPAPREKSPLDACLAGWPAAHYWDHADNPSECDSYAGVVAVRAETRSTPKVSFALSMYASRSVQRSARMQLNPSACFESTISSDAAHPAVIQAFALPKEDVQGAIEAMKAEGAIVSSVPWRARLRKPGLTLKAYLRRRSDMERALEDLRLSEKLPEIQRLIKRELDRPAPSLERTEAASRSTAFLAAIALSTKTAP